MKYTRAALILLLVTGLVLSRCGGSGTPTSPTDPPDPSQPSPPVDGRFVAETVVSLPNFHVSMVFTSPDRILLTQKGGFGGIGNASVRVVQGDRLLDRRLITFRNVQTGGERGLLGITLDPNYQDNRLVYVYYTRADRTNVVTRFVDSDLDQEGETDAEMVIDDLPSDVCGNHQGGSIAFGPDGMLYVSVGDNGCDACNSQRAGTLAGKILRYTRQGQPAPDNPFSHLPFPQSAFFATGLRNSFDFTFHPRTGEIFSTENGPTANDEINRILPGRNYGWPFFQCDRSTSTPCPQPTPSNTGPLQCYPSVIAPTGIVVYEGTAYPEPFRGNIFFGDFNTGTLHRLVLSEDGSTVLAADDRFLSGFGRIIDLAVSPDGLLYVLTDQDIQRVAFVSN
jgi:glucose/arabinose dehydrogenase